MPRSKHHPVPYLEQGLLTAITGLGLGVPFRASGNASDHFLSWQRPWLRIDRRSVTFQINCFENDGNRNQTSIYGRRFNKTETLASDGCGLFNWQQGDRRQPCHDVPSTWRKGLASASVSSREARFYFSSAASDGICGWLFLARLPTAPTHACKQPQVLARENCPEPSSRPRRYSRASARRLEGSAIMGARAFRRTSHSEARCESARA